MHVDEIEQLFAMSTPLETTSEERKDQFIIKEKLGQGSYGTVYHCLRKGTKEEYAIKMIEIGPNTDTKKIYKEIELMKICAHPYVVRFYDSFLCSKVLWVVMEYCPGGSVYDVMKICKQKLTEKQIAAILAGTVRGLLYLHQQNIIHRDIKAANILLCRNGAKIADFGTCVRMPKNEKLRTLAGSSYWMAPEMIKVENGYDTKADVWALGILAIEMAQQKPPHHEVHHAQVIYVIAQHPPPKLQQPEQWSPEFQSFINHCLIKTPENRPTVSELLCHPFIQEGCYQTPELLKLVELCSPMLADYRYEADIESGNWMKSPEEVFEEAEDFMDDLSFVE